jgi:hypothetical protein
MSTATETTTSASRCVQVAPVGASLRESEYAATPELRVWVDRETGQTWLAVRFARVLLAVALEPGQVDTVTAGLLDEVPVPYELVDQDSDPDAVAESGCYAAHPDDSSPCDGPPDAVRVVDQTGAETLGCVNHGSALLASLTGGRVYPTGVVPGAGVEAFERAQRRRPYDFTAGSSHEPGCWSGWW